MADLALIKDGAAVDQAAALAPVRLRLKEARDHRRRNYEPTWHSNFAFASGKQWLVWDRDSRTLRNVRDMDPAYRNRELYTADVITEYRTTALGELSSDDDRPELLLQRDDKASEEYQGQANRAVGYAWDFEWASDDALAEADRLTLDLGTSAIRCRFDPTLGPLREGGADLPHDPSGKPILDKQLALTAVSDAQASGQTLRFQPIHQGLTIWEPLSAFNLIVPPGITHERYFPWECVVRPMLLADVVETYGAVAADLKADEDIGSILGVEALGVGTNPTGYSIGEGRETRLKDHVWLFTYYEKSTRAYPKGRKIVFAGNKMKPMEVVEELPYMAPNGTWRSGITYFHWWRVSGRFFSRGLVEVMKDGQRAMNKRATQENEIIDRAMPYVIAEKDSNIKRRVGTPMEVVEIGPAERPPVPFQGFGPGPWMHQSKEDIREDIEHGTGIRGPRLGENPVNVATYSQLALLSENEQTKREPIKKERRRGIEQLVQDSVYDMRIYWGPEKQIQLAGDNGGVQAEIFNASKLPTFYICRIAQGSAKPRTQAAQLKLIEDIYTYSMNAQQPVPVKWVKDSLEAGQPLALPEQASDEMLEKAEMENHYLMQGEKVAVDYFDIPAVHVPSHRASQIRAILAGQPQLAQNHEDHIQEHLLMVQQQAAQLHAIAPPVVGPDGEMLPLGPGQQAGPPETPGSAP